MKKLKLPYWLRDDLKKFAIGAASLLALFIVAAALAMFRKYAAHIITAACAIAASYALGTVVIYFTEQAKQSERNNKKTIHIDDNRDHRNR
jgi:hypothetical protein